MPPKLGNGKICYIEIPSKDIAASAAFYESVFGWTVRTRDDHSVATDFALHKAKEHGGEDISEDGDRIGK